MVAHRKNVPTRKAYVPSGWFIVLSVMLIIGGAGWLGALLVGDDDSAPSADPTPRISMSPEPSASAKGSPKSGATSATPTPTASATTPSASPTAASQAQRTATVSVLNNSGIAGAAKAFSAKVTSKGWTLGGIGNWSGRIDGNTVYYPEGMRAQAEQLGRDVSITRIRPAIAPMRMDRLTIILSPRS
jgi:hypothetical protein